MDFNQFIEKIMENDSIYLQNGNHYDSENYNWYSREREKVPSRYFLSVDWTTGGLTGGSCWGTRADQAVTADPPEELTDLDKILEMFCPAISFLQYKTLCANLVKTQSYTRSEYYGNYYNKMKKTVMVDDLFAYLVKNKLIND